MGLEGLMDLVTIFKKFLIIPILFSLLYSEKVYTFTEGEVKSLFSSIKEFERKDSLNNIIVANLESQINDYEIIVKNDSLIKIELEKQINLKDDLIKVIEPKWYENKYLWFGYGVCTILIPTFVFGR